MDVELVSYLESRFLYAATSIPWLPGASSSQGSVDQLLQVDTLPKIFSQLGWWKWMAFLVHILVSFLGIPNLCRCWLSVSFREGIFWITPPKLVTYLHKPVIVLFGQTRQRPNRIPWRSTSRMPFNHCRELTWRLPRLMLRDRASEWKNQRFCSHQPDSIASHRMDWDLVKFEMYLNTHSPQKCMIRQLKVERRPSLKGKSFEATPVFQMLCWLDVFEVSGACGLCTTEQGKGISGPGVPKDPANVRIVSEQCHMDFVDFVTDI